MNNSENGCDNSTNKWDKGYPDGGNYWSDFDEPGEGAWDDNHDGLADTPYSIPGGDNLDHYPLMNTWNGSLPPVPSGDTNMDGTVNIADLTSIVSYLFASGNPPMPDLCIGDLNADGGVNIADLTYIVAYLFGAGPPPLDGCSD